MGGIQYKVPFWVKFIFIFVYIMKSEAARCQPESLTYSLPSPPKTSKDLNFFVVNTVDQRNLPGKRVGQVIHFGKVTELLLNKSVEDALLAYYQRLAPEIKEGQIPLYIAIEHFQIQEKRVAPNKVIGEARIKVNFRWYRDMQPVELTSYESKANFTRPESKDIHSQILPSLLDQSIAHFEKWMTLNAGRNPSLSRKIVLRFKDMGGSDEKDTVFYSPLRPLKWTDFKGNYARPGSRYAAAVFTSFAYEGHSYPEGDQLVVEIGLKVFMVKSNSWAKMNAREAGTLRHEQLHFDLTRLAAEGFKKRLLEAELTVEDHDSEIQYQYLEAFRQMNTDQKAYDNATGHGTNAALQESWDRNISNQIKKLYFQK